ncbi:hypothetical protein M5K25_003193 [Dendrobium thyrsiflorum]|uniref:Uncharacterized protein n=1 Tax=Dendrobium thyrsiflorum TaxID=117978 RepID=A0ABD0VW13_DENTH
MDVKVSIASCLSEIIRITVSDAPYDDIMKDIFGLIVGAFKNLDEMSKHFLKTIRSKNSNTVFSSTETVITLVLEDKVFLHSFIHVCWMV